MIASHGDRRAAGPLLHTSRCDTRRDPPVCLPPYGRPCGNKQAVCYSYYSDVCWPDAWGGVGACCRNGTVACGDMFCCDVGDSCVATKGNPLGVCCRPGEKPCGDVCCYSGVCRNGTCVYPGRCSAGETPCGPSLAICCRPGLQCCFDK